jgi:hypothetical protein
LLIRIEENRDKTDVDLAQRVRLLCEALCEASYPLMNAIAAYDQQEVARAKTALQIVSAPTSSA